MSGFRNARRVLDEFAPDLVVIWGDDQYENFREDVIPPFCLLAYEEMAPKPWEYHRAANAWNEPHDKVFHYKGHQAAGKYLAGKMIEAGFDVSYAYRPLHHPLGHAFLNTLLFMDYDRKGFPYPVLPFQVNCYGRRVIAQQAGVRSLSELPAEADFDPPSPLPWRCFDFGAACARIAADSPYRVALVASSSWSHAFLTPKNWLLLPRCPGRPRALRRVAKGRLQDLARAPAECRRGQRPAGDPELDVPDGGDGRARPAADRNRLCRNPGSSIQTNASRYTRHEPIGRGRCPTCQERRWRRS